jgi:hypothetical protein
MSNNCEELETLHDQNHYMTGIRDKKERFVCRFTRKCTYCDNSYHQPKKCPPKLALM